MQSITKDRTILILGAGSDMAVPLIQLLFKQWQSCRFILLARHTELLKPLAESGTAAGHTVELTHYNVENPIDCPLAGIEICITYVGWLPPDNEEPEKAMLLNYTGIRHFLDNLIFHNPSTLQQIVITGSIAGVRVRPANRAYGQAKAALHQYALQLQQQWKGKIAVTLVIPGYVQTKMLANTKTPPFLTLSTRTLAEKYASWLTSKPAVVYSQPVWKAIGFLLKIFPQFIINRLKQ